MKKKKKILNRVFLKHTVIEKNVPNKSYLKLNIEKSYLKLNIENIYLVIFRLVNFFKEHVAHA